MFDRAQLVRFVRDRGLAVLATYDRARGWPEAALIGVASTDDADLVFDTSRRSRKFANLVEAPRVSLVIGWADEVTVQVEGTAEVLIGAERDRCLPFYLAQWPDGRNRLDDPDIVHLRVRLSWARYCDYRPQHLEVTELNLSDANARPAAQVVGDDIDPA